MRSGALHATLDRSALRLLGALAWSAAFHVSVILMVRAGVPAAPLPSGALIEARIQASAGSPREEAPAADLAAAATSAPLAARTPTPVAAPTSTRAPIEPQAASTGTAGQASTAARAPAVRRLRAVEHSPLLDSVPSASSSDKRSAPPGLPFAPDTTYYPIAALDRLPAPLSAPDVCYPAGATGEVTYELLIDETGTVDQASVVSASPPGVATAAAAERCSAIRFSPAIKGGRNVRSRVRLVVGLGVGG